MQNQIQGLPGAALAQQLKTAVGGNIRGADRHAGGQLLFVAPERHKAAVGSGGDKGEQGEGLFDHLAEKSAFAYRRLPVAAAELPGGHPVAGPLPFLGRGVSHQFAPGGGIPGQLLQVIEAVNGAEVGFDIGAEPLPVGLVKLQQLDILVAVAFGAAAKIDGAAHHPHAGAVAQDILRVAGLDPADHRDSAGLELGEGVAHIAEIPGLEGFETGVVLGHRVAAGPAAALDIEDSLGPGVVGPVGHIAEHGDFGPAVEPAHIIGGAAGCHDLGAEHPHGPQALTDGAAYPNFDRGVLGPDPAADSVLASGFDLQLSRSLPQGDLNPLLQLLGGDSFVVDGACYFHHSIPNKRSLSGVDRRWPGRRCPGRRTSRSATECCGPSGRRSFSVRFRPI